MLEIGLSLRWHSQTFGGFDTAVEFPVKNHRTRCDYNLQLVCANARKCTNIILQGTIIPNKADTSEMVLFSHNRPLK